jgi:hypothetical protein
VRVMVLVLEVREGGLPFTGSPLRKGFEVEDMRCDVNGKVPMDIPSEIRA